MATKIKSAWSGQRIPQQDNRSKQQPQQESTPQVGARPFGPGEASIPGSATSAYVQGYGANMLDNVMRQQMGGSYGGPSGNNMPMAPKPVAASMAPGGANQGGGYQWGEKDATSQPNTSMTIGQQKTSNPSGAPQSTQAYKSEQALTPKAYEQGIEDDLMKGKWNDQAKIGAAFGMAGKPGDTVTQADSEVTGMYGNIGDSAQTDAERKAYEILATPTADQAYWDAKAAAQTAEIDRQSAMLQRQLQQQVAAGGGGIGGVQIQNMAEIAAQANRAKSDALTALAKEKAYFMLEDKKTVVSLLFQGASLEQQTKLALLQAKMEQEAKNIDFGWTALSAAADFAEKGYDPTAHPGGDQINAAFQTDGTFRDPETGLVWRQGPDGNWYVISYGTDPKGRIY